MEQQLAEYVAAYTATIQHPADRSMTRYKYDLNKMVENNEISTGPGRWALGVPNAYGNAVFVPDPTIRQQKWGASHDMSSTKTDVESDLRNLGRPTTRTVYGQYSPEEGARRQLTAMPEADFPQTHARLIDPPCTLRGTGWNRWEWLCQNPQENVMMPFEWGVDSRHASKDALYATISAGPTAASSASYCGRVYMDPAVPAARLPRAGDAPNFTNTLAASGGAVGAVRDTPRGAAQQGARVANAPPRGPDPNPAETQRAATGLLAPPPPFTAFIAPH